MVHDFLGETLGHRIKKIRRGLRITQEDLAARLNVSPQHISAIEVDRRLPSLTTRTLNSGMLSHT